MTVKYQRMKGNIIYYLQEGHYKVQRIVPDFIKSKSEAMNLGDAVAPMTGTIVKVCHIK